MKLKQILGSDAIKKMALLMSCGGYFLLVDSDILVDKFGDLCYYERAKRKVISSSTKGKVQHERGSYL